MGPEEADQRSHRTGQHPACPDGHEGEQGQRTRGRAHHGESHTEHWCHLSVIICTVCAASVPTGGEQGESFLGPSLLGEI